MSTTGDRAAWLQGPQAKCSMAGSFPNRAWRLILLGAPGIGKGTQAEFLHNQLGACHLSTGDVFRAALCHDCVSPAMQNALGYMKRGDLVPDETVIEMVVERVGCLACAHGFLLDGYPRTVMQARALDALLAQADIDLDGVVSFELEAEKVIARLSGRRTCRGCKRTYHTVQSPPRVAGVCDVCGGELYQREDDRPDAIAIRLRAYEVSTAPLIEYYGNKGLLHLIDADGAPDVVFGRVMRALGQGDV